MHQVFKPHGAILLVEDRADVRQGLAQLLELHGFLVTAAATGEIAWQELSTCPDAFSLMLLDLRLPGRLSGYDLRARQLEHPALSPMPTVIMTACEPDAPERAALRADGWLDKPFHFADLLKVVTRYAVPVADGGLPAD